MILHWDAVNLRKIQKHGLAVEDVEEALADNRRLTLRTKTGQDAKRYKVIGKTVAGDFVRVILGITQNGDPRVVTAFPAPDADIRAYRTKNRR
ncbi:MAG: DUF4258 domain-containing protein [Deinococcota bacterium]